MRMFTHMRISNQRSESPRLEMRRNRSIASGIAVALS